ncbi:hypothetical protein ACFFQA_36615 [Allokutzneria oryzae]|uniref:Secreted protein n=1 Tax=Allokutzneria oryzae TaxID=1378989 RepID=A0ABV6A8I1_9PSEU
MAIAGVLIAGGGVGAGGIGAAGSLSSGASSAGSAVESAALRNISARKVDGKKAAKSGNARTAWQRMGMRELRQSAQQQVNCVAHSFGRVREFLVRTPCKSLDRKIFAVGDDKGNVAVISVAWLGFRTAAHAQDFKRLIDVHGSGDITPLASGVLGMADIRFTANHYDSRIAGSTVVLAEAEAATGHPGAELLDSLAEVAVLLPRP